MEAATMHEVWVNLATNSPFLAFVIYNWYQQTKQNEAYRQEMKTDREAYEKKREEAIEDIRNRYSKVIDDLKQERGHGIEQRLQTLEKSIKKIFAVLDVLKKSVEDIQLKDKILNLKQ